MQKKVRLLGKKVIFITGTDERGEKIAAAAAASGSSPSEHCDLDIAYESSSGQLLLMVTFTRLIMRAFILSTVKSRRRKVGSEVAYKIFLFLSRISTLNRTSCSVRMTKPCSVTQTERRRRLEEDDGATHVEEDDDDDGTLTLKTTTMMVHSP
ncbi:hypothetical protein Q3G72_031596 [Acer saccharum]|nr:hypothetical protein Q3G72_031596 [Acer saccharum]